MKTTPGRALKHAEGVSLSASGTRIVKGLLACLLDARAELKLAADELAVVETMLEYRAPVEDSVGVLQMTGDDKKPIICSACGKVHPTRATVKPRPGGLVCVSDCGLLTEGRRRKRPAEGSEPPPPLDKHMKLAVSDEEEPPPPSTTCKQPPTADEVHPSDEPGSAAGRPVLVPVGTVQPPAAAMPAPAPQCASRNEPPALLVQCVSTEPSVTEPPVTLQPISDEAKDARFAKYGRIEPVASQSFASLDMPPIDDGNAGRFPPPRLDVYRSAAARGSESKPALWFKQVLPRPPSTQAAAHRLLTSLIYAVSLTDDGTRVGCGRGRLQGCRSRLSQAALPEQRADSAARARAAACGGDRSARRPAADPAAFASAGRCHVRRSSSHHTVGTSALRRGAARCFRPSHTGARACRAAAIGRSPAGAAVAAPNASVCAIDTAAGGSVGSPSAAGGSVGSPSTHFRRVLCSGASPCDAARTAGARSVATAARGAAGAARSTASIVAANLPEGSSARAADCGHRASAAAAAGAPRFASGGRSAHAAAGSSRHRSGAFGVPQPLYAPPCERRYHHADNGEHCQADAGGHRCGDSPPRERHRQALRSVGCSATDRERPAFPLSRRSPHTS
ncbi:MAG: hypothetical protein CBC48_22085 [bacterium TMED88]|nr:MAG: hypothetical protein CBC48_22085 [bacterium TMED88]